MNTGIIGAGSWGIALAALLDKNGHKVTVWSALPDEIDMLEKEREHKSKLPGVVLNDTIGFSKDLESTVRDNELLVMAVPSPFVRKTAASMKDYVRDGQIIVNVAKGIEEQSLMTLILAGDGNS